MKRIILLILLGLSYTAGHAQSGELYFSLTPIQEPNYKNQTDGIYMEKGKSSDPLYNGETIHYHLKSVARDIDFSFAHINYNTSEMTKRNMVPKWNSTMEIITTGNNIASSHTVYNLDSFFRAKSKKELIDWFTSLDVVHKKIYFFDQRDYDKGKITLIQVKLIDYGLQDNLTVTQ